MTAWGWAGSAPAPSTADLESAPRLPPMAAAVAGAAEVEVLALAPVRPASAEEEVVVAEEAAAGVAAAGGAVDGAKTPVDADRGDAAGAGGGADAVHSTDNSPASETGGARRLRCPARYRSRRATPR